MQSVLIAIQKLMEQAGQPLKGVVGDQSQAKRETAAAAQAPSMAEVYPSPADSGSGELAGTKRTVIPIEPSVLGVYKLSHQLVMNYFAMVFAFSQRWRNKKTLDYRTTVIWGWDAGSLADFCVRFLHRKFDDEELERFLQQGLLFKAVENHRYIVVNESVLDALGCKQMFSLLNHEPYRTYLLVNTVQQGAAVKQIRGSILNEVALTEKSVIHWVSQSFKEFIEGHNASEGLQSLVDISGHFDYKKGLYLINDNNPIYSLLLAELSQMQRLTVDEEAKMLAGLSKACGHLIDASSRQICADLMKTYISLKGANIR